MADYSSLLESIKSIAVEAGHIILGYYNDEIEVTLKDDESPLTMADQKAHDYIVAELPKVTSHPIISEESGVPEHEDRKSWTTFWLVDPLDGTKEFIKKNGEFTVNIALIDGGVPVLGVVYAPAKELLYFAAEGFGSWKQVGSGEAFQITSHKADPKAPITVVASRSHGSPETEEWMAKYTIKERVPAGSSLKFCLIADGTADVYPRLAPTMEWDVAAGDAVHRYSAAEGVHESGIAYNKTDLRNKGFVVGF